MSNVIYRVKLINSGNLELRVKSIDFHPSRPIICASLFDGRVILYDCLRGSVEKTISLNSGVMSPVRTCKFIPKSGDLVAGNDLHSIFLINAKKGKHVFEYKEAHDGYVRCVSPHPTEDLLLSCGDDNIVKLWDTTGGDKMTLVHVYNGHSRLVMDVQWNPKDSKAFASASLDGSVMFWNSGNHSSYTLKVSNTCVNSISFCSKNDRNIIACGCDDKIVHIWDYQTRSLISKLERHTNNVTRVLFHPTRPLLISTSEDNMAIIWSTLSYRSENIISSNMERYWALSFSSCHPFIAFGNDYGFSVYKFKHQDKLYVMDTSGKLLTGDGTTLFQTVIKNLSNVIDGNELDLVYKDVLSLENMLSKLIYSFNSKFFCTLSGGDYVIYTALGFRNKAFGKCLDFAWSLGNKFAILTPNRSIEIFPSPDNSTAEVDGYGLIKTFAKKLWGGQLISTLVNDGVEFYDWNNFKLIRRIEVVAKDVKWYEYYCAIRTKENIYILSYNDNYKQPWNEQSGYEDSFDIVCSFDVKSTSIAWAVGELLYCEGTKIVRIVGGRQLHLTSLNTNCELIGYLPKEQCIILTNNQSGIISVSLPLSLLQFEVSIANGEEPDIALVPENYRSKTSKFLRQLGRNDLAMKIADDPSLIFDLYIESGDLENASKYANDVSMWKKLARMALINGKYSLTKKALIECGDLNTLLVLLKAKNDIDGISELYDLAIKSDNIGAAFSSALLLNDKEKCYNLLVKSNKFAEAAIYSRANFKEKLPEAVSLWKSSINNERISSAIADPTTNPELF